MKDDYTRGEIQQLTSEPDWDKVLSYGDRCKELGMRMNQQKLQCPKCSTRQVQLVGYINIKPAQWRCRQCKHNFDWEGVC